MTDPPACAVNQGVLNHFATQRPSFLCLFKVKLVTREN